MRPIALLRLAPARGRSCGRPGQGCLERTRNDPGLERRGRSRRRVLRSARSVIQLLPSQPLVVARLSADPVTPAQLAHVRVRLARQTDELLSLFLHGDLTPGQCGLPPLTGKVSPMSTHTWNPCARSKQGGGVLSAACCRCGYSRNGNSRRRLPVRTNSALASAGASGGTAISPTPPGLRVLAMRWVSTSGASARRTTG